MAFKLWNLLHKGMSHYGDFNYGRATGGSTTTIVDTVRDEDEESEDFEQGTAIILRDSAGAGAAPEGEISRIATYTTSNSTLTLADTLTGAVASGDRYGITSPFFQHDELIELMNDALEMVGEIGVLDESITTVASQTEYTLPVALKRNRLRAVRIQGRTDDSNDNRWVPVSGWRVEWSAAASASVLTFDRQFTTDRTIQIEYLGLHPTVNVYSDTISEYIHPQLARAAFVERLANRAVGQTRHSVPANRIGYDKAAQEFEDALIKHEIFQPEQRSKYFSLRSSEVGDDTTPGNVQFPR